MKILNNKAFSIIEIIIVVLILSILASTIIPSLLDIFKNTSVVKCKNEMLIIQSAIKTYTNKNILKNQAILLTALENNEILFSNILKKSFHNNSWNKLSNNTYQYSFDNEDTLNFIYDSSNYSFTCNKNKILCQEVLK